MAQKMEKLPNKTPRPIEGHKPAAALLRDVVDKVYANAWEAKRRGELVGWILTLFIPKTTRRRRLQRKTAYVSAKPRRIWATIMIFAGMLASVLRMPQENRPIHAECRSRIFCCAVIISAI